jgi:hypothetical protein
MSIFQRLRQFVDKATPVANLTAVAIAWNNWEHDIENEQDIATIREFLTKKRPDLLAKFEALVTARQEYVEELERQITEMEAAAQEQ